MVKYCAWSEDLGQRSDWLPDFGMAARTRAGQMPDAMIVEHDSQGNQWTWWERDGEGEWIPVVGGTFFAGCNGTPW